MKTVVFKHTPKSPEQGAYEEEVEFFDGDTEEEIVDAFINWVFQKLGETFSWHVKEESKMKIAVFKHNPKSPEQVAYEEEVDFYKYDTDEEIGDAFIDWVFRKLGDTFSWHEKEN